MLVGITVLVFMELEDVVILLCGVEPVVEGLEVFMGACVVIVEDII